MNLLKKYLLTAVALLSISKLSIAEDLSPIDDHICNNILEFGQEENEGVEIPTLERLLKYSVTKTKHYYRYHLALEAYVFYGKCLLLNSENLIEKRQGRAILQSIARLGNYPSRFFLAQYLEMETGHESIEGLEKILSAYKNVIPTIRKNATMHSFGARLANTVVFLINYKEALPKILLLAKLSGGGLFDRYFIANLQAPPLVPSLFINSINENWWLSEEMAYYKVPQLHLISMIEQLKKLPLDEIPEETSTKNGQAQPHHHYEDTFYGAKPVKQIIEDTIHNIIDSAESCMSDLEGYPLKKSIIPSIYSACEELREIALDLSNGSRFLTLEEAENLEAFLQSQEERFLPVHSLDLSTSKRLK